MYFTLLDNFIVILLALVSVFRAEYTALFVLAAGFLIVAITVGSMFRSPEILVEKEGAVMKWTGEMPVPLLIAKLALLTGFAFLSGSWIGFVAFAVLNISRPWIVPVITFFLYSLYALLGLPGAKAQDYGVAEELLFALAAAGITALFLFIKFRMKRQMEKEAQNREQLRRMSISEMREKKLNRELAKANYLADKNARLTERENISRNIHNSVGHSITAAIMTLYAADMLYDTKPEEARKRMNDANERIRGSLESIRRAVRTLDDESASVPVSDLRAGLDSILNEFLMDTEIRADRVYEDFPEGMELPHEYVEFLTGVLQECLTNGLKHGGADFFLVKLSGDSAHVQLMVKDNGKSDYGVENEELRLKQGFGLKKVRSFAERCGGRAEFENAEGFRTLVELPVVDTAAE